MRRVLKYGGTSIESADRVRRAAQNVARLVQEGDQVAVVVSAQGNDTNLLLSSVYAATEHKVDPQTVYRVAAMGEEKTVLLLCAALRSLHVEAVPFLPTDAETWPLVVDCEEGPLLAAQKINEERPLQVRAEESRQLFAKNVVPILRRGGVAVIAGFFARPKSGVGLITLGRGGSDISGVLCGDFLSAEEVTIITDVEGILSADPRLAQGARLIEEMTVADLEVMAARGARVVHPRAIRYKPESLRVRVVDFRRQEQLRKSGTTLLGSSTPQLTLRSQTLAMLTLVGQELASHAGVLADLAWTLARAGISMAASNGNDSFVCLYLPEEDGERAYRLLHEQITPPSASQSKKSPFASVTLRKEVAEIRLRSPEFLQTPGVLAEITSALGRRKVNILEMITSLTDIYIYVDRGDGELAQALLSSLLSEAHPEHQKGGGPS